jgi:hypothetical protein
MAVQIQLRNDTAANWTAENPTLAIGEVGLETDTSKFKIGNGSTAWNSLAYAIGDLDALDGVSINAASLISNHILAYNANTSTWFNSNAINVLNTDIATINETLPAKANLSAPTFTGTVVLPSTTSIGDVSATEIGHLNNVTSSIQPQLDDRPTATEVSGTYAPLNSPTFTGTVVLSANTSIGDVSASEISVLNNLTASTVELNTLDGITASTAELNILDGATLTVTELNYVDGVTSAIQTQLDSKAPTANATFTGTVSGITKSMVGLGNADNTSDADKPVSTATQTALNAKLNLAGGTMTGKITLDGDPTQSLHAVTKQYVDNVEAGLKAKPSVVAATTANLTADYANGTSGVGATLTGTANGAFPQIDGVSVTTVNGQRGVLVKNQTNAAHNGRYNLTTQGDAGTKWVLTRCSLCDQASEIPGAYVFVTDGTLNGQTGWVQHVDDPATFVIGTDDIDVFQFAGAGTITAGTNISVSGNQVSVVNAPTFSGVVTASANGVAFSDGTQTKIGVPSITTISQKTTSYTLSSLTERDIIVEISNGSATTLTIPTNANVAYPVGTTIDIIQTGAGQITIAGQGGVTVNATPGLKLRTQWSSATLLKRATDTWLVFGDLTA